LYFRVNSISFYDEERNAVCLIEQIESHTNMPEISRFFGIIIRMFYDEHNPPHFHAEFQGKSSVFDFQGNILKGSLGSRTAVKLVREWIDLHTDDLLADWELASSNKEIKPIEPLN